MFRSAKFVFFAALLLTGLVVAKQRPEIQEPSYFREKGPTPISERAIDYLARHQEDGRTKIWVFFTDKGIFNKNQFASAALAAKERLTDRARARREKHGVSEIQFIDLPVNSRYVDELKSLGAEILGISKWLNAATIEIDLNRVGMVSDFVFVQRIQPAVQYRKPANAEGLEKSGRESVDQALESHMLSYGSSFGQLNQVNIPMCHDSGFAGAGIVVSVFDTGFRKSHTTFAQAYLDGRVLAEYDFVFNDGNVANEAGDFSSAWSHGTSTWSTCGGESAGTHYGPAFDASFIICKTEDVQGETIAEEYNWVSAAEWCDSIGTNIITSSLGYSDWYVTADYDGNTCVTTIAADIAASLGILVVNSAGNNGPGVTTINAPADADSIITAGAVTSTGTISSFSSVGPSADGRIKPEVCAQGSSVAVASSSSDVAYGFSSGTSFSCPLTAGVAAVVWGANPGWTNMQVREALMNTASNSLSPNNTYGWGIINAWSALNYSFGPQYVVCDSDGDAAITISDAVHTINYIFAGGPSASPVEAAECDCNGVVTISDAVFTINYIFAGGPMPIDCD